MDWQEWIPLDTLREAVHSLFVIASHTVLAGFAILCYKALVLWVEWLFPGDSLKSLGGYSVKSMSGWLDAFVVVGVLLVLAIKILEYFWGPYLRKWIDEFWRFLDGFKTLILVT